MSLLFKAIPTLNNGTVRVGIDLKLMLSSTQETPKTVLMKVSFNFIPLFTYNRTKIVEITRLIQSIVE